MPHLDHQARGIGRTFDDRLFVRFPALLRLVGAASLRLPVQSRLRRLLISRTARRAYAAANRRDWDRLLVNLDPSIELRIRFRGGLYPPDLDSVYYGRQGYQRMWESTLEVFEDLRLEPQEIIDLGDRLVVSVQQRGHGRGSGAPVSQEAFQVFWFRRGLVIQQNDFGDRQEALEAAGLLK